jgi:hypothetical protein
MIKNGIYPNGELMPKFKHLVKVLCLIPLLTSCEESVVQKLKVTTVSVGAPTYSSGHASINAVSNATLAITFSNVATVNLVAATGDTTTPPTGIVANITGSAACTQLDVTGVTTAGGLITVSGCTGTGTVVISVDADAIEAADHVGNLVSATRTVTVDGDSPTTTSFGVTDSSVDDATGANIATVQFSEIVQALSTTNANGEFTISGCSGTDPSVAIAMSNDGSGHSIATATLSGGTCSDTDTVSVEINLDKVSDQAGNPGLVADNPAAETYVIDLGPAVTTLAAATYDNGTGPINSNVSFAILNLTLSNADSTTLAAATGSSAAPPAGLTLVENGASCTDVELTGSSANWQVKLIDCTGVGNISVQVDAGVAESVDHDANVASAVRTVLINN